MFLWGGGCDSGSGKGTGIGEAPDHGARAKEVLPSMRKGLEYRRHVVIGDGEATLRRALAPFVLGLDADETGGTPAGFPDAARRAVLRANGFRLIPVPMGAIEEVVQAFDAAPVHDSTWLGQATDWMTLASGPKIGGTRIFSIGEGTRSYNEGQFRLLVRSYVVTFPERMIIRLEFLPQWYFEEPNYFSTEPDAGSLSGELLGDFAWALNLDGTMAAVLICEDPLFDWETRDKTLESADEALMRGEEEGDGVGADAETTVDVEGAGLPAVGPEPIPIRTLGEEVLQSVDGARRLVIVFLPHLGDSVSGD